MLTKNARHGLLCLLMLAGLLVATTTSAIGTSAHSDSQANKIYLQRAVSCLVGDKPFQDYALKFVNLKVGDWALARYYIGPVVDRSYKGRIYNVVLYSKDMKRSVMGSVIPDSKGNFEIVENGYLLVKYGDEWSVEEGNGGYRDYETVSKFVTSLSRKPFSHVHIVSQLQACFARYPVKRPRFSESLRSRG